MTLYIDTSAAMKLIVREPESQPLALALDRLGDDDELIASWLLHTELHCAAARRAGEVPVTQLDAVLDMVTLVDLTRADLLDAPRLGAGLRSQEAVHLAVAARTDCDAIFTYDGEQAAAAERLGLRVHRPV